MNARATALAIAVTAALAGSLVGAQPDSPTAAPLVEPLRELDAMTAVLREENDAALARLADELAIAPTDEVMSLIEVFLASNNLECLDLWIEGFCLWMVITVTPQGGVQISFHATPQISHYNPDFVVTSYGRIGASPLQEADLLYDAVQTEIAAGILALLSDHGIPDVFRDEDHYSGREAGGVDRRTTAMFSEVEVIGHPGNVLSLAASGGELFGDAAGLIEADMAELAAIANQAQAQATDALQSLVDRDGVLPTTAGNHAEWNTLAPNLGETELWQDQFAVPAEFGIAHVMRFALAAFDGVEDIITEATSGEAALEMQTTAAEYLETVDDQVAETLAESEAFEDVQIAITDSAMQTPSIEDEQGLFDPDSIDWDAVGEEASADIYAEINEMSDTEITDAFGEGVTQDDMLAAVDGAAETLANLETLAAELPAATYGVSAGLPSFCPSDTRVLTPHYLSGVNALAWRYQVPEMAFPQAFAFPTLDSEWFVGDFSAGLFAPKSVRAPETDRALRDWSTEVELPDWSTWGSVYPRSGWIMQPDEVKNRALAGFRAAHVVTRDDQVQLYKYARRQDREGMRIEHPQILHPHDKRTGAWQMLSPKPMASCEVLGQSELDGGILTQRDPDFTAESGAYVYNLWRQYLCCNEPDVPGYKRYLGTQPARIKVL